jgi:hypothetical protein
MFLILQLSEGLRLPPSEGLARFFQYDEQYVTEPSNIKNHLVTYCSVKLCVTIAHPSLPGS